MSPTSYSVCVTSIVRINFLTEFIKAVDITYVMVCTTYTQVLELTWVDIVKVLMLTYNNLTPAGPRFHLVFRGALNRDPGRRHAYLSPARPICQGQGEEGLRGLCKPRRDRVGKCERVVRATQG